MICYRFKKAAAFAFAFFLSMALTTTDAGLRGNNDINDDLTLQNEQPTEDEIHDTQQRELLTKKNKIIAAKAAIKHHAAPHNGGAHQQRSTGTGQPQQPNHHTRKGGANNKKPHPGPHKPAAILGRNSGGPNHPIPHAHNKPKTQNHPNGNNNNNNNNAKRPDFATKIVGGNPAKPDQYPFFVNWMGCGGSLINKELVLSAAHCNVPFASKTVRIGVFNTDDQNDGEERNIVQAIQHPDYNDNAFTPTFDFVILKLDKPSTKQPIEVNKDTNRPGDGDELTVIGHGVTSEDGSPSSELLQVVVQAISHSTCVAQYGNEIREDVHMCAGVSGGGKDSCQGDSGGPIFEYQNGSPVQVGVVSFGQGCAQANYSGVYARVSGVTQWIEQTICNLASPANRPSTCGPPTPTPGPRPQPIPAPAPTVGGGGGGGGFAPSAFAPSDVGNFAPSDFANFAPSEFGNFAPSEFGNFAPSDFANFAPSDFGNFAPSEFANFAPSDFENFAPSEFGTGRRREKEAEKSSLKGKRAVEEGDH